jgi:heme/copper-type cytochrome/quinol oxidase subunit 3
MSELHAAGAVRRGRALPNGWWGMALFLCAELALFGTVIGSYYYLSFVAHRWPPYGVPYPAILEPSVAIGVLVLTTAPIWLAARAARRVKRRQAGWALALAMFLQVAYLGFEIYLWKKNYDSFHPDSSAYASAYFTVLTLDHAHVLLGILLDWSMLLFVVLRGVPRYSRVGMSALALYWYVVNFLSVCVYLVLLSPRL